MNTKHTKPTDQPHTIKLESKLQSALWSCSIARGGTEVPFEVRTIFVGNGADIEVVGKSSRGKAPGKLKGKIFNNRFEGALPVPENVHPEAFVWFEAKLPRHKLKLESNEIAAAPPILVRKMQWSATEARRGDVLTLSAEFITEIADGTEALVIIYEYDSDGNHDPIAKIPTTIQSNRIELQWEYEYHEDTDEIPTEEEMQQYGKHYNPPEYFFVVVLDGERIGVGQESGLLRFRDWVDFDIQSETGEMLPNHNVVLHFADRTRQNARSDQNGCVLIQDVPAGPITVEIPDDPDSN